MGILRGIASFFYRCGVGLRNWFYDVGISHGVKFDIPIVCVGNIAAGGTGKTPTVEFLVDRLGAKYQIAVLSRGYGRRTKGYREVDAAESYLCSGDEPKQIKLRFPNVLVVVCADRVEAVRRITAEHPEIDLIVMDDGFQHRRIVPKVNVVLSEYSLPPTANRMLPAGTLRDLPSQLYRANIILITKSPDEISPIDRNIAQKQLRPKPYQSVFFTGLRVENPIPIFADVATERVVKGTRIAALSGIANPEPFFGSLDERYDVVRKFRFPDHHVYRVSDVKRIAREVAALGDDVMVVTTEKDGVKLTSRKRVPKELQRRLFMLPVAVRFCYGDENKFLTVLEKEIKNTL